MCGSLVVCRNNVGVKIVVVVLCLGGKNGKSDGDHAETEKSG